MIHRISPQKGGLVVVLELSIHHPRGRAHRLNGIFMYRHDENRTHNSTLDESLYLVCVRNEQSAVVECMQIQDLISCHPLGTIRDYLASDLIS